VDLSHATHSHKSVSSKVSLPTPAPISELWNTVQEVMLANDVFKIDFATDPDANCELWKTFEKIYIDNRLEAVVEAEHSTTWALNMTWDLIFAVQKYATEIRIKCEGGFGDVQVLQLHSHLAHALFF
jgi:hypothetical protein